LPPSRSPREAKAILHFPSAMAIAARALEPQRDRTWEGLEQRASRLLGALDRWRQLSPAAAPVKRFPNPSRPASRLG
jgi:hypothetical protein